MVTWREAIADFGRRWDASRLADVREHWRRFRAAGTCRWSLLPRGYCGGCYRGHHNGEPKANG